MPNTKKLEVANFVSSTAPTNTNNPPISSSEVVDSSSVLQPRIAHTSAISGNSEEPTIFLCNQHSVEMDKMCTEDGVPSQDKTPTTSNFQEKQTEATFQPRCNIVMQMDMVSVSNSTLSEVTPSLCTKDGAEMFFSMGYILFAVADFCKPYIPARKQYLSM